MKNIPEQLQNSDFKFYLAAKNDKLPIEKNWNTTCNYNFFEEKLQRHKGNIGIVTGFGNLIVLDFDNIEFYNSVADKLPATFAVRTAKKKLPHLYYILKGEMFKKKSIRDDKDKTLMDIQAANSGIICPPSSIDRAFYRIDCNNEITEITLEKLQSIFKFETEKRIDYQIKDEPEKVKEARRLLDYFGIVQMKFPNYKCPYHEMLNHGNLSVTPSGRIYCFHEQKTWRSAISFLEDWFIKCENKQKLEQVRVLKWQKLRQS